MKHEWAEGLGSRFSSEKFHEEYEVMNVLGITNQVRVQNWQLRLGDLQRACSKPKAPWIWCDQTTIRKAMQKSKYNVHCEGLWNQQVGTYSWAWVHRSSCEVLNGHKSLWFPVHLPIYRLVQTKNAFASVKQIHHAISLARRAQTELETFFLFRLRITLVCTWMWGQQVRQ